MAFWKKKKKSIHFATNYFLLSWIEEGKQNKKNHYQTKGCYFWDVLCLLHMAEDCTFFPITYGVIFLKSLIFLGPFIRFVF